MSTYTEQLAEINAAITNVLTAGQSLKRGDGGAVLPDINVLLKERARLTPLAKAEEEDIDLPVERHALPVRAR